MNSSHACELTQRYIRINQWINLKLKQDQEGPQNVALL